MRGLVGGVVCCLPLLPHTLTILSRTPLSSTSDPSPHFLCQEKLNYDMDSDEEWEEEEPGEDISHSEVILLWVTRGYGCEGAMG